MSVEKPYRVVRNGKSYFYHRKGKGAVRILSQFGTPEFQAELRQAHTDELRTNGRLVSDLCKKYLASQKFKTLALSTQVQWGRWVMIIDKHFGSLPVKAFEREALLPLLNDWKDQWSDKPRTSSYALQVLTRLLNFGISHGYLNSHICKRVERDYKWKRSEVIWTNEDIETLRQHASAELMHAVDLGLLTGLRRGDLLRLRWDDIRDDVLIIRTSKTDTLVEIGLYPALKDKLSEIPKRAETILTNERGQSWKSGFGSSWNKAIKPSGLKLHFHDLRGTAATRLAEAGFLNSEIALILGWEERSVQKIVFLYIDRKARFATMNKRLQSAFGGGGVVANDTDEPAAKAITPPSLDGESGDPCELERKKDQQ